MFHRGSVFRGSIVGLFLEVTSVLGGSTVDRIILLLYLFVCPCTVKA